MNTVTSVPVVLGKGVEEFVKEKGIEEGFATLCELARQCVAGVFRIDVELVDDPDEEDRKYVSILSLVPEDYPIEQAHIENLRMVRLRGERIPWSAAQHLTHNIWHTAR